MLILSPLRSTTTSLPRPAAAAARSTIRTPAPMSRPVSRTTSRVGFESRISHRPSEVGSISLPGALIPRRLGRLMMRRCTGPMVILGSMRPPRERNGGTRTGLRSVGCRRRCRGDIVFVVIRAQAGPALGEGGTGFDR